MACIECLEPSRMLKCVFDIIQKGIEDENESNELLVDLLEALEVLIKRYPSEGLNERKSALVKLMLCVINHQEPAVRLFGYRNLVLLYQRCGSKVLKDISGLIDSHQVDIFQVYLSAESSKVK
eukprot:NODE_54_length_30443_cov_1.442954.p22 type:complete len:123 gc:universal NODE_54_length_30443_cov_1.442954:21176-21544(+)